MQAHLQPAPLSAIPARCALAALLALFLGAQPAPADVPLAPRLLDPQSPEEAWNVIGLATANVARLIDEKRFDEVAEHVSLCSPALRILARSPVPLERRPQVDEQTLRAFQAVNVAARGSTDRNPPSVVQAFAELEEALEELARDYDPEVVNGEIFACLLHPDRLSRESSNHCETCGAALRARRIPYSFVYVRPPSPTMTLATRAAGVPRAGEAFDVIAQLRDLDGGPVPESDLLVTHTRPVHFFVTDPDLDDCRFVDPEATAQAGDWAFSFTPARNGPHRVWAAVVPVETALDEHLYSDLGNMNEDSDSPAKPESFSASVNGLRLHLSIGAARRVPLRAGITQTMRVNVTDAEGRPVRRLEPIMQAFAHVVGFYADHSAMLHLHPQGEDVLNEDFRGGPNLSFKLHPPKPGVVRLFCLLQVDGERIVAPFAVNVSE